MARKSKEPQDRRAQLARAAERFGGFRPAREVLSRVRAVPTVFPQFDHAVSVGGLPVERFMLMHGPSGEGKSAMCIGLMRSFLERDHFAVLVDAERTSPITWMEEMMGAYADHPGFRAERPETYEETIAKVRSFLVGLAEARAAGDVPEDTSALIVVDSLRKLVPAALMKEILAADEDVTAGRDRGAQLKAKMNAAWMDELVPLLERAQSGFVAIAREMEDPEADVWARRSGNNYKVGGGAAIYYDASLVMRVERAGWVQHGEGKDRKTYGERHRVTVRKTKVAGHEDRSSVAYFHTSNGVLVPRGFDRPRDLLELGRRFGLVEQSGSWFSFAGERIGQGEHGAVEHLHANPELLRAVETACRAHFAKNQPIEHDADGVVV